MSIRAIAQAGSHPRGPKLTSWAMRLAGMAAMSVVVVGVGWFSVYREQDAAGIATAAILFPLGLIVANHLDSPDETIVVRIFLLAFAVRVVAVFVLHHFFFLNDPTLLAGDDVGYDTRAVEIAQHWRGAGGEGPAVWLDYTTYVGVVEFLASGFRLVPRVVNAFAGSLAAAFTAASARQVFDARASRAAGLCVALFPSAVVWTSLNLREGWALAGVSILVFVLVRQVHRRMVSLMPLFLVGLLTVAMARAWTLLVLAAGVMAGLLWRSFRRPLRAVAGTLLIGIGVTLLVLTGAAAPELTRLSTSDVATIRQSTTHGGSAFEGGLDPSSPGELVQTAPRAIAYVLFGPFPWQTQGTRQALALPEVLLWYAALLYAYRGMRAAVSTKPDMAWPLVGAICSLLIAFAVVEGNLGLLYRHRLHAFVILAVFVGGGLSLSPERRHGPIGSRQPTSGQLAAAHDQSPGS
jgi:hypothetical protein